MASNGQQPAKQRKRDAVGNLRALAHELGVPSARKSDMPESEFLALHYEVVAQAHTPQHRDRAAEALRQYSDGPVVLPPIGQLPALPALGGVGGGRGERDSGAGRPSRTSLIL